LKFTEKVYPHLAAREQHFKEPPVPKIKSSTTGQNVNFNLNKKKYNKFLNKKIIVKRRRLRINKSFMVERQRR